MTRSDISYTVNHCSRYFTNATPDYDIALKRIVRYLVESKDLDLRFEPSSADQVNNLIDYTDASHDDCLNIRKINISICLSFK